MGHAALDIIPAASQAVLLASSEYPKSGGQLRSLPHTKNNIADFATTLIDEHIVGMRPENVLPLINVDTPREVLTSISRACKRSEDVFLFYFAGHGKIAPDGDLLLTTAGTEMDVPRHTSVTYRDIKEELAQCKARKKIAIIDSCFSGIAIEMSDDDNLKEMTRPIKGVYTLTATSRVEKAFALEGERYTIFTGILLEILKRGIAGKGTFLTLEDIYSRMLQVYDARYRDRPRPQRSLADQIGNMKMAFNLNTHIEKVEFSETLESANDREMHMTKRQMRGGATKSAGATPNRLPSRAPKKRPPSLLIVKSLIEHPIKNIDFGVPLGPWVLKSYLRKRGITIDIYDERLEKKNGRERPFREVIEPYDLVGFSVSTCEVPEAIERAAVAKKMGKMTVFGGVFSSSNEDYLLSHPEVDFVIPGPAVEPLNQLLRHLSRGKVNFDLPGVHSVVEGIRYGDLRSYWSTDTLPSIDNAILDEIILKYGPHLAGKIDIVTSRGCPYACRFCSIQKEQHYHITRDTTNVVNEILYLANKGFRKISIKDEVFPLLQERAARILRDSAERLKSEGHVVEFKIKSRIDRLLDHEGILERYYNWGVREIQFGVETPNPDMLNIITKGYDFDSATVKRFLERVAEIGITVNASLILGIGGESDAYYDRLRTFVSNLSHLERFKVYVNFYTPHPFNGAWTVPNGGRLHVNDLKCFTHKIPLVSPSNIRTRAQRANMLKTYEDIVYKTQSGDFNPPLDEKIREIFELGDDHYEKDELPFYSLGAPRRFHGRAA